MIFVEAVKALLAGERVRQVVWEPSKYLSIDEKGILMNERCSPVDGEGRNITMGFDTLKQATEVEWELYEKIPDGMYVGGQLTHDNLVLVENNSGMVFKDFSWDYYPVKSDFLQHFRKVSDHTTTEKIRISYNILELE